MDIERIEKTDSLLHGMHGFYTHIKDVTGGWYCNTLSVASSPHRTCPIFRCYAFLGGEVCKCVCSTLV